MSLKIKYHKVFLSLIVDERLVYETVLCCVSFHTVFLRQQCYSVIIPNDCNVMSCSAGF